MFGSVLFQLAAWPLILAGCTGEPQAASNELVYWRTLTGSAGEVQEELVAQWNEAHPETRVRSEFQGSYPQLATKLMTAAVAGTGPEVTQLGTFEIREFAEAGLLVDLEPWINGPGGIDTSGWPGTILDAGRIDGGLYWLPFNVSVPVLYYNKDAFAEAGLPGPPETWDQFFDYARRLTVRENGDAPPRYGLALWDITWPWVSAIWSEGGRLTNRDYTNITLDDPAAVAILEEVRALVGEGAAVMPPSAAGGHRAAFVRGRAAMILDSPAPFDEIMSQSEGFEPGVALYPEGSAGRVYAPGGGGLVMMSHAPEPAREGAWALIRYLLAPEQLARFAEASGYVAFTEGARAAAGDLLDDPRRATIHEALPHVRGDFSLNMAAPVRDAFDAAYKRIVVEGADVAEALRAADAAAEAGMAESS